MAGDRVEFLTPDGQSQTVMADVVFAALEVLRPVITQAWIDAHTAGEWSKAQVEDVGQLLAIERHQLDSRRRRKQSGMGIELDLANDEELALMARLAPFTIHAEAWAGLQEVFSASDVGSGAWFALTASEASDVAARLRAAGYAFEQVLRTR